MDCKRFVRPNPVAAIQDQPEQGHRAQHQVGDVELPRVHDDADPMDIEAPQLIEAIDNDASLEIIEDDLDINPNNEEAEEAIEPIQVEPRIKVEPTNPAQPIEIPDEYGAPTPAVQEQQQDQPAAVTEPAPIPDRLPGVLRRPDEVPGVVRRSNRVRFQTKEAYTPSLTGTKYDVAVTQMEEHGVLHPDAHMFFQAPCLHQSEPDVVAAIMPQLSLKAGLKQWDERATEAVHSV